MKLSCIPICLFHDLIQTRRMSLREWVTIASELGLDGIELYKPYLERYNEDTMQRTMDLIHEAGLSVSMFTSYGQLAQPDLPKRAEQVESIQVDIRAAVMFHTNVVRMTAGDCLCA